MFRRTAIVACVIPGIVIGEWLVAATAVSFRSRCATATSLPASVVLLRNSRRGIPLASSFADEEREMGARHHAPGSRRARVLGAQWIPQLRRPIAGTAVLGRLKWHVCRVVALRDETATARTIALQVPDWPGHVAGQRVDIRVTAADGSCLRPPSRGDQNRAFWTHGRSAPAVRSVPRHELALLVHDRVGSVP